MSNNSNSFEIFCEGTNLNSASLIIYLLDNQKNANRKIGQFRKIIKVYSLLSIVILMLFIYKLNN